MANYNQELLSHSLSKIIYNRLIDHGDNIAFIEFTSGKKYSNNDILKDALKLTLLLKKLGLQEDDTVVILFENHISYWVITIACLLTGIRMHALNPEYTKYELQHFLNMSKSSTIFCSNQTLEIAMWAKKEFQFIEYLICVDKNTEENIIDLNDALNFNYLIKEFEFKVFNDKEQVAFILNSSGTTGKPKGVMITHNNLKNMLVYQSKPECFGNSDTTISYLPFFHIFGIYISMSTMVFGMKSIIMSKFNPQHFLGAIQQYHVTHLFLVPPVALFLTKSEIVDNYNLSSVKNILCGAAPLGQKIEEKFLERLNVPIRQLYGMTELTGIVTIVPNCFAYQKTGSVGKITPGTLAKVRDIKTNQLLGPYQHGELCFKNECIMKGYLNNTETTANTIDKEGYLLTGDIGFYDDDGYFYIVDRLKELIKYKAHQVAPAELEDIINSHDGVKDSAVIGLPDERTGETPVAFVVKKSNYHLEENDIINYVAERVNTQKQLHGGVRFVSEIPKTATGKILRRKLRDYSIASM